MTMLDDWQRVKAVFEQALAVDETERSAFLVAACGSDALLRQRVDALMASHAASPSFLETGASSVLGLRRPGADLSGQTVGTYRLLSRIGAGAMGEVYAAHDEKLDRRVAVKLIAKDLTPDVDRLQRFRQEAHAASSLNHPNIVVVHDFGETDVRPFIVTELVEGVTLRERLKDGPLPIRDAIEIASQVTSALARPRTPPVSSSMSEKYPLRHSSRAITIVRPRLRSRMNTTAFSAFSEVSQTTAPARSPSAPSTAATDSAGTSR